MGAYLLVRQFMGAYFVDFEQVDRLWLFTHVKVPDSVQLASQAYNTTSK